MKYLYIFFAIIALKFLINMGKYLSSLQLRSSYKKSIASNKSFNESIPRARVLFKDAGLHHAAIASTERIGYGLVSSGQFSIVDNLGSTRSEMIGAAMDVFDQLVGTYKMRMLESISPRYWIELVVFLPKRIIEYLGGPPDGFVAKLLQVIYWLVTPALIIFRDRIYEVIRTLIEKL